MSCSAKAAPPLPWNGFTAAPAALAAMAETDAVAVAVAAAAAAGGAAVWARLTEETEPSTDCAAVAVRPALVRPRTNPRRDSEWLRYLATSSRMGRSLWKSLSRRYRRLGVWPEVGAEIIRHQLDLVGGVEPPAPEQSVDGGLP